MAPSNCTKKPAELAIVKMPKTTSKAQTVSSKVFVMGPFDPSAG